MKLKLDRMLFATGAALLTLAAAPGAHAVDVVWGAHSPARWTAQNPTDFFVDTFSFDLAVGSWYIANTVVSDELALDGRDVFSIIGGTYGLYLDPDGAPESGDETATGAGLSNFNGGTGNLSNTATVGAGNYYYLVTGLANGSAGGAYVLTSAVTPVPEPMTAALLVGGLIGLSLRTRRH